MQITPITPMTNVRILAGVPLTPAYTDVMTHASQAAQLAYFESKQKYVMSNATPLRNGVVRVPWEYDQLVDCNYLMYQNANFNNKWFFAFITDYTYINAQVTELSVTIDVWETFQFDISLGTCMVERMHVTDDIPGRYIAPEPLDTSLKLLNLVDRTYYGDEEWNVAVYYIPQDGGTIQGGNLPNMCTESIVPLASMQNFYNDTIKPLIDVGLADNVIGAIMKPRFLTWDGATYTRKIPKSKFSRLNDYSPVNKKLLTFPFHSIRVATANGVQAQYFYELMEHDPSTFIVKGQISLDLTLYGYFVGYQNTDVEDTPNSAYSSFVSGFPQPYFTGLQSLGFAAQSAALKMEAVAGIKEKIAGAYNAIKEGLGRDLTSAYGEFAGRALNRVTAVGESLGNAAIADEMRASQGNYETIGSLPTGTSSWAVWKGNFFFFTESIPQTIAADYDKYLTRWGYAVNKQLVPQLNTRSRFNFLKTRGAVVKGNIPTPSRTALCAMFDRGVTIWHQDKGAEPGSWSGNADGNPIG